MFPNDAKTIFLEVGSGNTTGSILSSISTHNRTILSLGTNCTTGVSNEILLNGVKISETKTGESLYKNVSVNLLKNQSLTYSKANNVSCFFTVVYTDYDLSVYGSGMPASLSGDGLMVSLELLIIIIFGIMGMVWVGIKSIKTHKTYTGVNQFEGKEHYDI